MAIIELNPFEDLDDLEIIETGGISVHTFRERNQDFEQYQDLFSWDAMRIPEEKCVYFVAFLDGKAVGGLAVEVDADEEEDFAYLISLHVEPEHRRIGIGSELLDHLKYYATIWGIETIYVAYQTKGLDDNGVNLFFIENGYSIPIRESITFTVKIDNLPNSYLGKLPEIKQNSNKLHIYTMDKISKTMLRDVAKKVPSWLSPFKSIGRIINELSFFCVIQGKIEAFVITEQLEGKLNIHGAYLKNVAEGRILFELFQKLMKSMQKEEYKAKYSDLTMTGIDPHSMHIISKILSGAEPTMRPLYKTEYYVGSVPSTYDDGVLKQRVRMQTISSVLEDADCSHELEVVPGVSTSIRFLNDKNDVFTVTDYEDSNGDVILTVKDKEKELYTYTMKNGWFDVNDIFEKCLQPVLLTD